MSGSVFVIGADGRLGRRLCRRLVNDGHAVTGMHRELAQFEHVAGTGAMPLIGNLVTDEVSKLARWMDGHHAVVLMLDGINGAGFFEARALEKALAAARVAAIERFVLVGGLSAAEPVLRTTARDPAQAQAVQCAVLPISRNQRGWTVVRHGASNDSQDGGRVATGPVVLDPLGSAENAAALIAGLLGQPLHGRDIVELIDGEIPITQTIAALIGEAEAAAARRLLIA